MQQYSHDIIVCLTNNIKQEKDFGLTLGWEICPPLPLTEDVAQLLQTVRELDDIPLVFEVQTTEEAAQPSSEELNPIFEFGADPSTPPTMPAFAEYSQNNNIKAQETIQAAPEALVTPQKNSFMDPKPIETATEYQPEQLAAEACAMDDSSESSVDYMAPTPCNKRLFIPKVECRSDNPTVIKKKRVTIEDSFKIVLSDHQQGGWYWIQKAYANEIASMVLAGQVKISRAGHPNEGKTGPRTSYSKLHDAMHKAKWIREDCGEYYCYSKKL